jgi:hypothetical protein
LPPNFSQKSYHFLNRYFKVQDLIFVKYIITQNYFASSIYPQNAGKNPVLSKAFAYYPLSQEIDKKSIRSKLIDYASTSSLNSAEDYWQGA